MNPTSRAILQTVFATDASLTGSERDFVQRLISGQIEAAPAASMGGEKLLITQKQAAELLSVNRVTIWRMTKDCLLHPVEIHAGDVALSLQRDSTTCATGRPCGGRSLSGGRWRRDSFGGLTAPCFGPGPPSKGWPFLLILRGRNSGAVPEGRRKNAFSPRKNFGPFFGLNVSKLPLVA